MSGESRYLAFEEKIVCRVRHHPALLARPLAEAIVATVLAVILGVALSPREGSHPIDTVVGLVAVVGVIRFGWKFWLWWADRIIVTNRRLFEVSGIFTRRVASMPLAKVTDMTYQRTFLGRVFGYGHMVLESPGQKQALAKIGFLPNPDDFYRTVTSLVMAPTPDQREEAAEQVEADHDDTGPLPRVVV